MENVHQFNAYGSLFNKCIIASEFINKSKDTAAAVIYLLRISNNGELKELEEGVKVKNQQLEKSIRP